MKLRNTQHNFGIIALLLHWVMALLIIGLFVLGKYMMSLDYYDSFYHIGPWWHKSFGLLIAVLLVFRIVWKIANPKLLPLENHKPYEINLAKLVQTVLYLSLIVCCLSGVLISTAEDAAISFFDWFEVPAFISRGKEQVDMAGNVHYYATYLLILFAAIHMLAALKHHFLDKDLTLMRIFRSNIQED